MLKTTKCAVIAILVISMVFGMTACGGTASSNVSENESNSALASPGKNEQVYFTTGTPGGVYEILGTGMVNVLNKYGTSGVEFVGVTPAQMQQAPSMMQSKEAMAGIGMACMNERAFKGEEEFTGNAMPDLMQCAGMYDNVFAFVVPADSPLEYVEDITQSTRIGSTATNQASMAQVIDACGTFDSSKMDYRVMSYAQASEALNDGNIDVAPLTGFPYSGTVDSLVTTKGVKFLKITDETRAKFDEAQPRKQMKIVPAGTYRGIDEDYYAYTTYSVLYVHKDLSEDIVYDICKTLIDNVEELALVHATGAYFTPETTQGYLDTGVMDVERMHPGAVKYFKEIGVIK